MNTRTYTDFDEAIEGAKEMKESNNDVTDFAAFLVVPEIYSTEQGFTVVLGDSLIEERDNIGTLLGYYDGGRFQPVEEVREGVRRDQEIEARDTM